MSEPTIAFDAKQALARVSDLARSAAARAGGKGKKFRPEDQREVIVALGELIACSALPLADIAQSVQNVSRPIYAETLGTIWTRMDSERRGDAVQWIEALPKDDGNIIRRLLVPLIAELDPRSARLILPAKPKALDSAEERERFARNWLGRDIGPFGALLTGELVEYEVTRVLRLLLRLAGEAAISSHIRSQVIRATAQALTDHKLAEAKTGIEPILNSLAELIAALPSVDASAVNNYLCDRTPSVASRLNVTRPNQRSSSTKETVLPTDESILPVSPKQVEPLEPQITTAAPESTVPVQALDPPISPPQVAAEISYIDRPRETTAPDTKNDDNTLISSLETRAAEHRDSALLLEQAVSRLKATLTTVATLEASIAALKRDSNAHDKTRQILETRIETLSKDLAGRQDQLRARTDELRSKEDAVSELERTATGLSTQLTDARNSLSATQSRLETLAASNKVEVETLLQRVASQTDQRLEEFRNDLARRVSEILRGTPPLDSGTSAVDGKAILFRLWEIIEALKRKSIPIRIE
jgi:cell division protein FtsB